MTFIGGKGVRRAFGVELLVESPGFLSDHRPNWAYGSQHFIAHQTTKRPRYSTIQTQQATGTALSHQRSILSSDCDILYILSMAISLIALACCLGDVTLLSVTFHG